MGTRQRPVPTTKKIRRRILDGIMVLLLLAGIFGLSYPFFKDALNRSLNQQLVNYYQRQSDQAHAVEMAKRRAAIKKANAKLAKKGNNPGKDTLARQTTTKLPPRKLSYYEKNTVGTLYLPSIKASMPVFGKTNDLLLQQGATVLPGTSKIGGGQDTHAVISAHRGLLEAKLFSDLPKVKKGQLFYIHTNGDKLAYQVFKKQVITPDQVEQLQIQPQKDLVTLMTCTPYMVNSHRLLVFGRRVPYPKAANQQANKLDVQQASGLLKWIAGIILGVMAVIVGWAIWLRRQRRSKWNFR